MQWYKTCNKEYNKDKAGDVVLVLAKNMETKEEISKIYEFKDLYKYYQSIPEFEGVESDVENVIKAVYK